MPHVQRAAYTERRVSHQPEAGDAAGTGWDAFCHPGSDEHALEVAQRGFELGVAHLLLDQELVAGGSRELELVLRWVGELRSIFWAARPPHLLLAV